MNAHKFFGLELSIILISCSSIAEAAAGGLPVDQRKLVLEHKIVFFSNLRVGLKEGSRCQQRAATELLKKARAELEEYENSFQPKLNVKINGSNDEHKKDF